MGLRELERRDRCGAVAGAGRPQPNLAVLRDDSEANRVRDRGGGRDEAAVRGGACRERITARARRVQGSSAVAGLRSVRVLNGAVWLLAAALILGGCFGSSSKKHKGFIGAHRPTRKHPPVRTTPTATQPNIVFILTDDLSIDLLPSCLTSGDGTHGLTFQNYFVSDSLCCPSRASIFTGNFPHDTKCSEHSARTAASPSSMTGARSSTRSPWPSEGRLRTAMMGKYLNRYLQSRRRAGHLRAAGMGRVGRRRLGLPGIRLHAQPERRAVGYSASSRPTT